MLWSSISSTLKFSLLSSHPRLGHAQIMTSRTRDAFHWVWSPRACQGQYRATYTCTRVHGKRERRLFRWGNSTVCPEKPPLEPTKRVSGQTVRSAQRIIRSTKSWSLFSLLYNIYAYIHVCIYIYIYIYIYKIYKYNWSRHVCPFAATRWNWYLFKRKRPRAISFVQVIFCFSFRDWTVCCINACINNCINNYPPLRIYLYFFSSISLHFPYIFQSAAISVRIADVVRIDLLDEE